MSKLSSWLATKAIPKTTLAEHVAPVKFVQRYLGESLNKPTQKIAERAGKLASFLEDTHKALQTMPSTVAGIEKQHKKYTSALMKIDDFYGSVSENTTMNRLVKDRILRELKPIQEENSRAWSQLFQDADVEVRGSYDYRVSREKKPWSILDEL